MKLIIIQQMYLQLVQKSTLPQRNKIKICHFLGNGNRYVVQKFMVKEFFNDLSKDISHFVVTQNYINSTCLRYNDVF